MAYCISLEESAFDKTFAGKALLRRNHIVRALEELGRIGRLGALARIVAPGFEATA
jgi:hypothetical protein